MWTNYHSQLVELFNWKFEVCLTNTQLYRLPSPSSFKRVFVCLMCPFQSMLIWLLLDVKYPFNLYTWWKTINSKSMWFEFLWVLFNKRSNQEETCSTYFLRVVSHTQFRLVLPSKRDKLLSEVHERYTSWNQKCKFDWCLSWSELEIWWESMFLDLKMCLFEICTDKFASKMKRWESISQTMA
mgnify:CR=1 FL=1